MGKCVKDVRTGLQNASSHFVDETILSLSLLFALPLPPPAASCPCPLRLLLFLIFLFRPGETRGPASTRLRNPRRRKQLGDRFAKKKRIRWMRKRKTLLLAHLPGRFSFYIFTGKSAVSCCSEILVSRIFRLIRVSAVNRKFNSSHPAPRWYHAVFRSRRPRNEVDEFHGDGTTKIYVLR